MESLPLHILDPSTPPWRLPHPYPTALTAPWSGSKPPLFEAFAEALLQSVSGTELLGELNPCPDDVLWAIVAECPEAGRVIVFAQDSPPADPKNPHTFGAGRDAGRWEIGIELLLNPEQPLAHFTSAMRLVDLLVPDAPSILDVATRFRWDRAGLERYFLGPAPDPPDHVLWAAHASTRSRTPGPEDSTWLRTSGLWRCGRPELEMLDLPFKHVNAGIALLQGISSLMLEMMPPAPGLAWRLGPEVIVALRHWDEVAPLLADELPGSLVSRGIPRDALHQVSEHPFGGVRAVVCGPTPRGTYRKMWVPPVEALERFEAGTAAIDYSVLATSRTARVALRTLPIFEETVQLLIQRQIPLEGPNAPVLLVKTPFALDDEGTGGHEHVWLRVLTCDGETIGGRVMESSTGVRAIAKGELIEIPRTRISDWHVNVGGSLFTPDEAHRLRAALTELAAAPAGTAPTTSPRERS